jgi:hypothetical protein
MNKKEKTLVPIAHKEQEPISKTNFIIANKSYNFKELNAIFSISSLSLIGTKEELLNYWQMAIETRVAKFIANVDYVFNKRFPKYE